MKKFFSGGYLDALFVGTLALLIFSVMFTLLSGHSPLEALGVSPLAATIGTVVVAVVLALVPMLSGRSRHPSDKT